MGIPGSQNGFTLVPYISGHMAIFRFLKLPFWLVVWNMFFFFQYILGIKIPTDFHIFQRVETTKQHLLLIVSALMFHIPPSDPRDLTDSGQIARVRTNSQDEFVTKILPQNFGDAYHNVPTIWFLLWYLVLFLWHSKSSWVITILQ
jgi:hypothetical protein